MLLASLRHTSWGRELLPVAVRFAYARAPDVLDTINRSTVPLFSARVFVSALCVDHGCRRRAEALSPPLLQRWARHEWVRRNGMPRSAHCRAKSTSWCASIAASVPPDARAYARLHCASDAYACTHFDTVLLTS
jgi:hypothetical protein